jgi:hypothetical protein
MAFPLVACTCCVEKLTGGSREIIARAIHEDYLIEQQKHQSSPKTNKNMVPWKELDGESKESNRRQADSIASSMHEIGCIITCLLDWDEPLIEFGGGEVEKLAEIEHNRWLKEKKEAGWTYGPDRDDDRKINPNLVAWPILKDEVKEYNRSIVRAWPRILARVDLKILRITKRQVHSGSREDDTVQSRKDTGMARYGPM